LLAVTLRWQDIFNVSVRHALQFKLGFVIHFRETMFSETWKKQLRKVKAIPSFSRKLSKQGIAYVPPKIHEHKSTPYRNFLEMKTLVWNSRGDRTA